MASTAPKISLSLLDLLFCAFGGVIVMAVVFISIAGEDTGAPPRQSGHIDVRLVHKGAYVEGVHFQLYPDSMESIYYANLVDDSNFYYDAKFVLYPYSNSYDFSENNIARLSYMDYRPDTLYLKTDFYSESPLYMEQDDLSFEVARFTNGIWDTISLKVSRSIPPFYRTLNAPIRIKIPLK